MFNPRTLKTLLIGALSVAVAISASADVVRLGHSVVPIFQEVHLNVDANDSLYTGEVTIQLRVDSSVNSFALYAEEMKIDDISLSGAEGDIPVTSESGEYGRLTLTSETALKTGDYTLIIAFTNNFNTQANSLYRLDVEGEGYTYTQFEADDAREAFPCWDEPEYKIPWQVTITVPERHEAISNTPFTKSSIKDGQKTIIFKKTPPLPSYLIALATGPLEFTPIPGMRFPARVVTVKGKSHLTGEAVAMTKPIMDALEEYFGTEYPFEKLDLIAVPEFWAGAMENPGAITYRETALLMDPETATVGQRRRLAEYHAHEFAHMWFGDLVTMVWWDDLWLNESFANWMSFNIADQIYPEFELTTTRPRSYSRQMSSDARPSAMAIRQPVNDMDVLLNNIGAVYTKGGAVLNMIQEWLGFEKFRQGLRGYLKTHEWSNATADDLWKALSDSSGKDVGGMMRAFVEKPGVPVVDFQFGLDGTVSVSQKRFSNFGVEVPQDVTWKIPLSIKYSDGGEPRTADYLLTSDTGSFKLESDGPVQWALPNPGLHGYYRWNADPAIIASVAEKGISHLEPRETIGYLGNLSALLDAGTIGADDFMRALEKFSNTDDPIIVEALVREIDGIDGSFITDSLEDKFSVFVRKMLLPALKRFGYEPKVGESETTTDVRPDVIGTLADAGHYEPAMEYCEQVAKKYYNGEDVSDPGIISTAVVLAARGGDWEMYQNYKKKFEEAKDPAERSRYLSALGSFRDEKIRDDALHYVFTGPIRPQELFTIPGGISRSSDSGSAFVFQWIQDNFEQVVDRIPKESRRFLPYFGSGCSRERLEAARAFFMDESRREDGYDRLFARIEDQVNECITLREREGAAVAAYLNSMQAN